MTLRVLPDAELLVSDWLRAHSDLDPILGNKIFTALPAGVSYPCLVIRRLGGVPVVRQHLDRARIQCDIWGRTKYEARTAAAAVQAALHEMPAATHALGVVTGVEDDLGLTWSEDPASNRPRYTFGVLVYLHPTPR